MSEETGASEAVNRSVMKPRPKTYRLPSQSSAMEQGADTTAEPPEGEGAAVRPAEGDGASATPAEGAVAELAGIMKTLLRAQEAREQRWEKTVETQSQQWETMCQQLQRIQGQHGDPEEELLRPSSSQRHLQDPGEPRFKEPKLHPLSKKTTLNIFWLYLRG